MASNAEDFVLRLHDQVSPSARAAESALAQLEARIEQQRQALSGYEQQLEAAAAKLQAMANTSKGSVNVAAFRKQQAVVASLQQKIDDTSASMDRLGAARPLANQVGALEGARNAITQAADAVGELEARLELLKSSEGATSGQTDALTQAIDRQRQAVVRAQQAYVKMGGTAKNAMGSAGGAGMKLASGAEQGAAKTGELADALGGLEGPVGDTVSRGQQLTRVLQALGPAIPFIVAALAAIAFAALAVAILAAVVAATKFAIKRADAARSQRLANESLAANHKALANIEKIMPRVQDASGLAAEEIRGLAADLAKAKVPAQQMEAALKAMATAKAGGANAEFLAKLQARLKATGKVPAELAAQMAKFESIAKRKMLSLDAQGEKLKRNVTGLFSGLKIEGFLTGLSKVVALFDSSTASGRALKVLMEGIFQPLIDAATRAIPLVIRGFLLLTRAALRAFIAVKPLYDLINQGGGTGIGLEKPIAQFNALAASANAANAAMGTMGGTGASAAAQVQGGVSALKSTSLADVGANMMSSLADSILSGGSAVVSAITSVVGGAVATANAILDIKSPSRVFARIGAHTAVGMAQGIAANTNAVQESMANMASPEAVANEAGKTDGATSASIPGSTGGGQTVHVEIRDCVFGDGIDEAGLEAWAIGFFHRNALAVEAA
jgi:hypothetical protein